MFTDIHHHCIYGVDDGPKTLQEACRMLEAASAQDIGRIICTSHARPGIEPFPGETYLQHLEEELAYIERAGLRLKLFEGCEILWDTSAVRQLQAGQIPSLNGTQYVLVEFFPDAPYSQLEEAARSLCMAGYAPIFAHVERFRALRGKGKMERLQERYGVICQMNASTVIASQRPGLFGDRWPRQMLTAGSIDLVATDAHNVGERRARMQEAHEVLTELLGKETADRMCQGLPREVCLGRFL